MSGALDLGTLTVKLAADVAELKKGLADVRNETKKSADSFKTAFRAATGAFDGPAGALQGIAQTAMRATKSVQDIFGDQATARGQRWGKEIAHAIGLATGKVSLLKNQEDQTKGLEQAMRGLAGAAELVGQALAAVKVTFGVIAALGLGPFVALIGGIVVTATIVGTAIGAVIRHSDDLKKAWEEVVNWFSSDGTMDAWLDKLVNTWKRACLAIVDQLEHVVSAWEWVRNQALPGGLGVPHERSGAGKALDTVRMSIRETAAAFGSKEDRAATAETAKETAAEIYETAKEKIGGALDVLRPVGQELAADFSTSMDPMFKAVKSAVSSALSWAAGFLTPGQTKEELREKLRQQAENEKRIAEAKAKEEQERFDQWLEDEKRLEDIQAAAYAKIQKQWEEIGKGRFLPQFEGTTGATGFGASLNTAINDLTSSVTSNAKHFGAALQGFTQGISSGGGIWGGIIGAIGGLLSQSRAVATIAVLIDQVFSELADTLGGLFDAVGPLFASTGPLAEAISQMIVPSFQALGVVMAALWPVTQALNFATEKQLQALAWLTNGLLDFVKFIFGNLKSVFDGFAGAVTAVASGLVEALNGVVRGLSWLIWNIGDAVSKIPGLGEIGKTLKGFADQVGALQAAAPTGAWATAPSEAIEKLGQWGQGLVDAAKINGGAINTAAQQEMATTWSDLRTKYQEQADALDKSTKATNKFAEALTNLPSGYRVAAARYAAQSPVNPDFARSGTGFPLAPQYSGG